jgi:hypothetical protein
VAASLASSTLAGTGDVAPYSCDTTTRLATGLSTESRLARMLPLGRELMSTDRS